MVIMANDFELTLTNNQQKQLKYNIYKNLSFFLNLVLKIKRSEKLSYDLGKFKQVIGIPDEMSKSKAKRLISEIWDAFSEVKYFNSISCNFSISKKDKNNEIINFIFNEEV